MLFLCASIAVAQSVDLAALEVCASLETPALKLACFEALIPAGKLPEERVPEVAVAGRPEDARAAIEPGVAAAGSPGDAPAAIEPGADAATAAPGDPPVAIEPEPGVVDSHVVPEVAPMASSKPSDDDFGREQLAAPDEQEEKQVIKAMVIDVTRGYNKALYFHLANGQVWRQIEARHFRYPGDGDFEVIISKGIMGEYRLRVSEDSPMTRIRRVE